MIEPLEIRYLETSRLTPYANNSRTHSDEQIEKIVASIDQFGFTNPVLIDEGETVIAGHGRLLAAQKIGLGRVPTITLAGLTEAQRKAYVIADNRLALDAGWNFELLKMEVEALGELGFEEITLTGFTEAELGNLFLDKPAEEPEKAPKEKEPVICPKCSHEFIP